MPACRARPVRNPPRRFLPGLIFARIHLSASRTSCRTAFNEYQLCVEKRGRTDASCIQRGRDYSTLCPQKWVRCDPSENCGTAPDGRHCSPKRAVHLALPCAHTRLHLASPCACSLSLCRWRSGRSSPTPARACLLARPSRAPARNKRSIRCPRPGAALQQPMSHLRARHPACSALSWCAILCAERARSGCGRNVRRRGSAGRTQAGGASTSADGCLDGPEPTPSRDTGFQSDEQPGLNTYFGTVPGTRYHRPVVCPRTQS